MRDGQGETNRRLITVERKLEELSETAITAMGYAAHANVGMESSGQRMDALREEIDALKRRIAALEDRA